jgi:transposase
VLRVTGGQAADGAQLAPLLDEWHLPAAGPGRPRTRPALLLADKAYGYPVYRAMLRERGIRHVIPLRADHRERLAHRPGRRPLVSRDDYRRRNTVERGINRLKQWRGLATRYDRRADHYRAVAVIVALILRLAA